MGRQWEGRFYPDTGPRVEKLLGVRKEVDPDKGISETEAFAKLVKIMGTYEAPKTRGKVTFSEVVPRFKAHKEAKNREDTTMAAIDVAIRCHLEPEFGPRYLDEIDSDDFEAWMAKELKKYSPKSVKNWRSVANSLWEFAVKKKMVSVNVVAQTEAPYRPEEGKDRRDDVGGHRRRPRRLSRHSDGAAEFVGHARRLPLRSSRVGNHRPEVVGGHVGHGLA
ncbi:MAG TPA: hypothetical protein VGI17_09830 [Solirubrobacterales bacterium]|jgi:hypothetical protein